MKGGGEGAVGRAFEVRKSKRSSDPRASGLFSVRFEPGRDGRQGPG